MAKSKLGSGQRFAALKAKIAQEPGVTAPAAVAASIGRKKFGSKKMAQLSAKGKKVSSNKVADGMDAGVSMEHPSMSARKKAMMAK